MYAFIMVAAAGVSLAGWTGVIVGILEWTGVSGRGRRIQ